jgi:peptide-methionine (S)-S-oxide reductase
MSEKIEIATLAGGCFWCTEAIFTRLKGIKSVKPGYSGGHVRNPSYEQVSMGTTGHAESIQIEFDPDQISFDKILEVFWHTNDPTTLNRQGADVGTQYRSAIFFHDEMQKETAEESKNRLENERVYPHPVVTEIVPFTGFFVAENYHINYFENHRNAPYCSVVIAPKVQKLLKLYGTDLKEEYKNKEKEISF